MKISVIITSVLVAQVAASFFDVFNGAVLSVQNSFGKLLNDVVTDVKETVDCTILAVEHVLSLSPDATARYYEKCRGATNKTDAASADARQDTSFPKVEVTFNLPNHEEYLEKIPAEIDVKINETLSKVFDNHKPHDNAEDIEKVLNKESEKLAGVGVLVKKELEKLTNKVNTDLKDLEKHKNLVPSVDAILQEIKVLEKREQNTKNASEAHEIHKVIQQILGKLDAIKASEATENIRLEDILKDLENDSNNSFVGLRQQFEEWKKEESTHLTELKNKIEDRDKIADGPGLYYRHGSNDTQPVIFNRTAKNDSVEPTLSAQEISYNNTSQFLWTLGYSLTPRIIGDSYNQTLLSIGNEPSPFQNNTLKESGLNDTVIKSTSLSITENSFGITENALRNETIQSVDNKTESTSLTTNDSTNGSLRNENNSTESGIISNPLSTSETSLDGNKSVHVATNTDSKNDKWADLDTNSGTVVINVAERVDADLTSTHHNIFNSDNTSDQNATEPNKPHLLVEITSVNATDSINEKISILTTKDVETTSAPMKYISSNDTLFTTSTNPNDVNLPVNETGPSIETSTIPINVESSTLTIKMVDENRSSTSLLIIENATVSETTQPQETTTASGQKESITDTIKIVDKNDSNVTIKSNDSLSIIESTTPDKTIKLEETSTNPCDETTKIKDKDSENTRNSSLIVDSIYTNRPANETTESSKPTTASNNENTSSILITSTGLPIIKSESSTTEAITMPSGNKEYSIESELKLSNTSNIKTTPTPVISKYVSEIVETINTTTGTDHGTIPMISEGILTGNITVSEYEEPFLTTDSPNVSMTTLMETNCNTVNISNTPILMNETLDTTTNTENATVSTTSASTPTENITVTEIEKPFLLTTESPTVSTTALMGTVFNTDSIMNKPILTNETIDTTTNTDNATVSTTSENTTKENIKVTEIEEKNLLTTEPPIVSTTELQGTDFNTDIITNTPILMNETIDTSSNTDNVTVSETTFTENIKVTEIEEPFLLTTEPPIVSTTELKGTDFNTDISTTPILMNETIDITTVNDSGTLSMISEITPTEENTVAENEEPLLSTTDSLIVSSTLTDADFKTEIITNTPIPTSEIITVSEIVADTESCDTESNTSLSNTDFETTTETIEITVASEEQDLSSTSTSTDLDVESVLIENITTDTALPPTKNIPITETITATESPTAFEAFDSFTERFLRSESLHGSSSTPLMTSAPELNTEYLSYVPTLMPKPYFVTDKPSEAVLTTYRPKRTSGRAKDRSIRTVNNDSVFNTSQKDAEAHQRALREARQLIANSRRSARIINNIMKNKNKYNARSIFG